MQTSTPNRGSDMAKYCDNDIPRFSVMELKDVFRECDELRAKLESTTEELEQYRPE